MGPVESINNMGRVCVCVFVDPMNPIDVNPLGPINHSNLFNPLGPM